MVFDCLWLPSAPAVQPSLSVPGIGMGSAPQGVVVFVLGRLDGVECCKFEGKLTTLLRRLLSIVRTHFRVTWYTDVLYLNHSLRSQLLSHDSGFKKGQTVSSRSANDSGGASPRQPADFAACLRRPVFLTLTLGACHRARQRQPRRQRWKVHRAGVAGFWGSSEAAGGPGGFAGSRFCAAPQCSTSGAAPRHSPAGGRSAAARCRCMRWKRHGGSPRNARGSPS